MSESNEAKTIFDLEQSLTITGGDVEMFISIVELFSTEGPNQLNAIRDRMDDQDREGIQRAAHQLKGSVVIFGAAKAESAALKVEQIARKGDMDLIAGAWDELANAITQLMDELETIPERLSNRGAGNSDASIDPSDGSASANSSNEGPLS